MPGQAITVRAGDLMQAGATIAQHLEAAAQLPTGAAPTLTAAAAPADVAAAGVAEAIQTKIAALSSELMGKGPEIQSATASAATSLQAKDDENEGRLAGLRSQDKIQAAGFTTAAPIGELRFDESPVHTAGYDIPLAPGGPFPPRPHLVHCVEYEPAVWICEVHDLGGGPPQYIEMPGGY